MTNRRQFLRVAVVASIGAASRVAGAQPARVEETDPQAIALGYRHDATKVDTKKYPTWAPGRVCANCQLFQGKPSDPWAPCGALGGKLVNAKGWCVAWVKKA